VIEKGERRKEEKEDKGVNRERNGEGEGRSV